MNLTQGYNLLVTSWENDGDFFNTIAGSVNSVAEGQIVAEILEWVADTFGQAEVFSVAEEADYNQDYSKDFVYRKMVDNKTSLLGNIISYYNYTGDNSEGFVNTLVNDLIDKYLGCDYGGEYLRVFDFAKLYYLREVEEYGL